MSELEQAQALEDEVRRLVGVYSRSGRSGPDAMVAMYDIGKLLGVTLDLMGQKVPTE